MPPGPRTARSPERTSPEPGSESPLAAAVGERDRQALALVSDALRRHDTLLAYQPVVTARPPHVPAFHEGLIRVLDTDGRIIPARDFMAAVESLETGRQIDCAALDMGLRALARRPDLRLAINMSARSIAYPAWMRGLRRALRANPDVGPRLILEISEESAMALPDIVRVFMQDLRQAGVSFALDDFGAGLTSFTHLGRFLFEFVKIDGRFIRGISANPDNQCLVRAMAAFCHELGMYAVAESVEDAADAAFLGHVGIDCLQGYHFGAPSVTPPWKAASPTARQAPLPGRARRRA